MVSHFGWVDFAGENQKKMLDVVKLFRERETRDELGIGTIRDAFSNFFFPGTSTIQTRAKYMLFIPWIYKELERKKLTYPEVVDRARQEEIKLIYALLKSDDHDGIIGQDSKDTLKRLPSSIYWAGLYSWGILLFPGSQDQYFRSLRLFYEKQNLSSDEGSNGLLQNWDPGLPEPPDNLMDYAELGLLVEEAEYLEERITCNHHGSLLYYLINNRVHNNAGYFWDLPVIASLPEELQYNIIHGRNFSETIYGAAQLYNFLLARSRGDLDLIDKYHSKLAGWSEYIKNHQRDLYNWYNNLPDFWLSPPLRQARIPYSTKAFVERWYNIVFRGNFLDNFDNHREAELLISDRELRLKGKRARLHNPRALEMWQGAAGDFQQDYRWSTVRKIIYDIVIPLIEEENKIAYS